MVTSWIRKNLEGIDDPRRIGKALAGNKRGYWRYRIGDYRLICTIEDEKLVIIALNIGPSMCRTDFWDRPEKI